MMNHKGMKLYGQRYLFVLGLALSSLAFNSFYVVCTDLGPSATSINHSISSSRVSSSSLWTDDDDIDSTRAHQRIKKVHNNVVASSTERNHPFRKIIARATSKLQLLPETAHNYRRHIHRCSNGFSNHQEAFQKDQTSIKQQEKESQEPRTEQNFGSQSWNFLKYDDHQDLEEEQRSEESQQVSSQQQQQHPPPPLSLSSRPNVAVLETSQSGSILRSCGFPSMDRTIGSYRSRRRGSSVRQKSKRGGIFFSKLQKSFKTSHSFSSSLFETNDVMNLSKVSNEQSNPHISSYTNKNPEEDGGMSIPQNTLSKGRVVEVISKQTRNDKIILSSPKSIVPTQGWRRSSSYSTNSEGRARSSSSITSTSNTSTNKHNNNGDDSSDGANGNPVVYRYFSRSRARSIRSDSIPFIILGPRVDHWKIVGRVLASKGFNVMACERVLGENGGGGSNSGGVMGEYRNNGEALITAVLDALKWSKAILVGCDQESVLAMEAALRLAPDRVAGLVLCGDLTHLEEHIEKQIASMQRTDDYDDEESLTVDSFLRDYVECPCTIIWDGDASAWSTRGGASTAVMEEEDEECSVRSAIIGGGSAPYRKLPEQFAWTLSRFVENQVSEQSVDDSMHYALTDLQDTVSEDENEEQGSKIEYKKSSKERYPGIWAHILPLEINQFIGSTFSPGSLLVSGRAIASAIIYISLAKVSLFQYKNFRSIQSSYLNLTSWEKQIGIFVSNIGRFSGRIFATSFPKRISNRLRRSHQKVQDSPDYSGSGDTPSSSESDNKKDVDLEIQDDQTKSTENEQLKNDEKDGDGKSSQTEPFQNFFFLDQVVS